MKFEILFYRRQFLEILSMTDFLDLSRDVISLTRHPLPNLIRLADEANKFILFSKSENRSRNGGFMPQSLNDILPIMILFEITLWKLLSFQQRLEKFSWMIGAQLKTAGCCNWGSIFKGMYWLWVCRRCNKVFRMLTTTSGLLLFQRHCIVNFHYIYERERRLKN